MYGRRQLHRSWILVGVAAPIAVALACGGSDNAPIGNADDDGGGDGSSTKDGRSPDAGDGLAPVVTTYNDFANVSFWQFNDFSALLGQADAGLPVGYLGAV